MRLQLAKKNGLYYADVNDVRAPRMEECNTYSLFTDDWIPVLGAHRSDKEVEGAWAVISRQAPEIKALRKHRDRTTHTSLPTLLEDEAYQPLLDPLAEREFDPAALGVVSPTVTQQEKEPVEKAQAKKKPRRNAKARPSVQRPVTPSEQLESELWAARLGFCRWW